MGMDCQDWDDRENRAITACALRFDGYKYFDDHRLFSDKRIEEDGGQFILSSMPAFDQFLDEPDFSLPANTLHAMFFFLQRSWIREGWLRPNSYGAKIARQLFLLLCREEVEPKYQLPGWPEAWRSDFAPHLNDYIELVEQNLKNTRYTSKEMWQKDRI